MPKPKINLSFGLFAKEYQKHRREYDQELFTRLFSLLPAGPLKILDIGCGTGKSTEPLITNDPRRSVSAIGLDPDDAMLAEARASATSKGLNIEYVRGFAEELSFEPSTFDAVISGAAFHWYGNMRTLAGIKSVLKENGLLFIFWVQFVETGKPAIGSEIFERYGWQGIPKEFRGQPYVTKLLDRAGYAGVAADKIPFIEKRTIEQTINLLKTNSSYAVMTEEKRRGFVAEMTAAYEEALGKDGTEELDAELLFCYGRKV